jgi:hypothetical protein
MTSETILLAILVFALVATRPFEEGRWRSGRMSDRTSALLVVARLPILVLGFAIITARPPEVTLLMVGIAGGVAALLFPMVAGRLRRVREGR